jgi:hypothetical protein
MDNFPISDSYANCRMEQSEPEFQVFQLGRDFPEQRQCYFWDCQISEQDFRL